MDGNTLNANGLSLGIAQAMDVLSVSHWISQFWNILARISMPAYVSLCLKVFPRAFVGFIVYEVDISLGGLNVHFNTDLSFPEPATSLGKVRYPKQESLNKLMSLQTVFFFKCTIVYRIIKCN